jgi:hypothetical protein
MSDDNSSEAAGEDSCIDVTVERVGRGGTFAEGFTRGFHDTTPISLIWDYEGPPMVRERASYTNGNIIGKAAGIALDLAALYGAVEFFNRVVLEYMF